MEWVGSRSCAVFVNAQKSDFSLPEQNKLRIESEIDASSDSSRTVRSPLGDGLRERHWYIWAGNWSQTAFSRQCQQSRSGCSGRPDSCRVCVRDVANVPTESGKKEEQTTISTDGAQADGALKNVVCSSVWGVLCLMWDALLTNAARGGHGRSGPRGSRARSWWSFSNLLLAAHSNSHQQLHQPPQKMKFSSGLVLAAVAVTAAHAGNTNSLRTTEETAVEHDHQSPVVARDPVNGQEIKVKDFEVDLEKIFGKSKDGIPRKLNLLDLIGNGNGQADLTALAEYFIAGPSGSGDHSWLDDFDKTSGSDKESVVQSEYKDNSYDNKAGEPSTEDDLSWLNDFDVSAASAAAEKSATKGAAVYNDADDESTGVKGGDDVAEDDDEPEVDAVGAKSATKGDPKGGKGEASGSDDLAYLFDDEAGSNMFAGVKGDSKNPAPFVVGGDSTGVKGGDVMAEDDDEPEVDAVGAKSATKGDPKGGKGEASGSDDLAYLFDDEAGSNMFAGVKGDSKNPAPFVVGGDSTGVKGGDKEPYVTGEDDDSEVDDAGASKASKASKTGGDDITFANLYEEVSTGPVGGEDPVDDKHPIAVAGATKGKTPLTVDDDDSIANEVTQDDVVQSDENVKDDKVAAKGTK